MLRNTHIFSSFVLALGMATNLISCGSDSGSMSGPQQQENQVSNQEVKNTSIYQIGPTWDARVVDGQTLLDENNFINSRIATNIAKVSTFWASGTAFYLGEINGQHLMATSAHVLKNVPACSQLIVAINFTLNNRVFTCDKIIGAWREIDLAIVTIDPNPSEEEFLSKLNPLKFDFNDRFNKGTQLVSVGYGEEGNPDKKTTLKNDKNCKIFSPSGTFAEVTLKDSSDEKNVMTIPTFATGCDISPGDSGSPMVNKDTGDVIGVMWATSLPKNEEITGQDYLDQIYNSEDSAVWNNLSYAVSSYSIRQHLIDWLKNTRRSIWMRSRRATIEELLEL